MVIPMTASGVRNCQCIKCGALLYPDERHACPVNESYPQTSKGWECPRCHRCWAPHVRGCDCK